MVHFSLTKFKNCIVQQNRCKVYNDDNTQYNITMEQNKIECEHLGLTLFDIIRAHCMTIYNVIISTTHTQHSHIQKYITNHAFVSDGKRKK